MSPSLVIAISNSRPNREERYPDTWLLYTQGQDPIEIHVVHDTCSRPRVLHKGAA
jgi:hypothetical protein